MAEVRSDANHAATATNARGWWSCFYFIFFTLPIFLYDGLALFFYTLVLLPAFARMAFYYFWIADRNVIRYDCKSRRQTMDIYWPTIVTPSPLTINTPCPCNDSNCLECRLLDGHDSIPSPLSADRNERIRQRLRSDPRPILVFVCGGAWMIGYKMWGALLARVLTHTGMTVILPDYRNYPFWGTVPDQVQDIEMALQWLFSQLDSPATSEILDDVDSADTVNSTRRKIILVGQSAGGHLVMTLLLRKVLYPFISSLSSTARSTEMLPPRNDDNANKFLASDLTGLIVLSAPLDLHDVYTCTFRKHGLSESFMRGMFHPAVMSDYDPLQLLEQARQSTFMENPLNLLPPIKVYHGSRDRTVPYQGSVRFVELFKQLSASDSTLHDEQRISFHMYEGWSHTDPILEGPMDADHRFHSNIFAAARDWIRADDDDDGSAHPDSKNIHWPDEATSPVMKRLCPHFLVRMGRFCMPF
jgi:acetyl esterase/lipase